METENAVLIDLGSDRGESITDDDAGTGWSWSRRRLRGAALAAGVALLLVAGGSAAPVPPPLVEVATLTVAPDRSFVLTPERLFVGLTGAHGIGQYVSAYEPGRGRLLWTVPYDQGANAGGLLERVGDLLLIRVFRDNVPNTTAIDAATGAIRWTLPGQVEVLSDGRTGMTAEDVFAPDARLVDPSRPASNVYYHAASGRTYVDPPVGQVIRLVDLGSGAPLWSSAPLGTVVSTPLPSGAGPDAESMLLVTTPEGRIELREARTGVVRRSLPAAGPWLPTVRVVGDLLLVQRGATDVTGYALDTLRQRWARKLDRQNVVIDVCGERPCVGNDSGSWQLDPATGAETSTETGPWPTSMTTTLRSGGQWFEMDMLRAKLLRTVDPATGRTLADLSGWESLTYAASTGPVLLMRWTDAKGPTWFGLIEPGATEVRLLGRVPAQARECQLAGNVIACHVSPSIVRLWRYQP
ncbi:putative pyrroloquinoline-quinone binding quinoprotein [Micromonospora pisi]|uniref:Putative pyrroloquinoline-quinone binding quinoprotein n=1 Tax=Micromonospora pisi TaxID=589240 RepID=A0A495JQ75_9ACTN|nr:PQQ-binding-like beta-propeller repeat protein [Micromonospora pisi]RKR90668.1 putative pyrroloquinoline-quinone binding quinoprotein [Micromonospora pisi]